MLSSVPSCTKHTENRHRSFVVIMRPRKTLFSFNTIFDVYLADMDRLVDDGYVQDENNAEKKTDPLYFGHIRLNHLWDSIRYYSSHQNTLYPHEAEELIDEIIFSASGISNNRKTMSING
jgi:hypothetical protein